jgi:photosystem II stability/assembly factor-like uncharacterized protein
MTVAFRRVSVAAVAIIVLTSAGRPAEDAGPKGAAVFAGLKYRSIGPAAGGRIARVTGVPGNPLVYYAATASGGVWQSTDGGINWKPIFDEQPDSSIGAIAVAPSDPNVIYVGAGEANIRGNVAAGHGIYKSLDAGKTWKHVWKQEGQIGTIAVHPTNPDVAFAAVLGHAFGPNAERGVYRTKDGGKTWQQVLAKDRDTGASDVCLDPTNPNIVFAGLWQARRRPWEMTSGGPGSGLYVSRDGGDTWKHLTGKGLPEGILGKIGVAVAPSDGRRVYALIEADKGGMFRSDDGGDSWRLVSGAHSLRSRPWYYTTITVDPKNPDVVWCPNVSMLKSIDGGKTFQPTRGIHHGDHHDIWIDPQNPRRMISANDGGLDVTTSGGETWYAPPLSISQFYHVAADNRVPYHVSGAMQDLGTASGPSNSLSMGGIPRANWHSVGGGEAGFTAPDPADPNIIYAGEYGGYISRYDDRTRQIRNVSIYPFNSVGHAAEDLKYRFQWTAPILVSPHDHATVYHAANVLFKTTDGGMTWTPISPDLTRNDKTKQKWSGGPISGDNTSVEYFGTIFAIAESPKQKDLLWAGSDDGRVHVSPDGGKTWNDVTKNMPGFPEWGTVKCIELSPFDASTAYVVVDAHRMDDMHPYLYKTTDQGKTWTSLSAKLPPDVYLHAVREDPKRKGLLYVGTEHGVSYSPDDGTTWHPLKLNLPTVAVHDLVVKNDDLVLGTHGRSIWILDDLTPIRHMAEAIRGAEAHLFPVAPATRWHMERTFGRGEGANPPSGAIIDYYLKKKPKGDVTLEIHDAQGKLVKKLSSKPDKEGGERSEFEEFIGLPGPALLGKEPGVNRFVWNLLYEGATTIKKAQAWAFGLNMGPLVLPGTYTAKLTVDGKTMTTPITVELDPRVHVPSEQLAEQHKLALEMRDSITRLSEAVNQIRAIRGQLASHDELLKDNPKAASLVKQSQEMIAKLDALEGKLHNSKAEVTYDLLGQKGGARLYSVLGALYGTVQEGDGPPTQGVRDLYAETQKELQGYEAELQALVSTDLARLQESARELALPYVIIPKPAGSAKKDEPTVNR